ncbi:MAG: hypothetical protein V3U16_02710 [Candidatus Neomarinimicrobiota bacterium]
MRDLPYQEMRDYFGSCAGSGVLFSEGDLKGKLKFTFTCSDDSSYVQFRDILGRRTLYMQLLKDEIYLWDMLKNRRYSSDDVRNRLPVMKFLDPNDLTAVLWGKIPDLEAIENEGDLTFYGDSTIFSFESSNTSFGSLVNQAKFKLDGMNNSIEIKITRREYGKLNEKLIREIPDDIPWN